MTCSRPMTIIVNADLVENDHFSLVRQGSVRLTLKFKDLYV